MKHCHFPCELSSHLKFLDIVFWLFSLSPKSSFQCHTLLLTKLHVHSSFFLYFSLSKTEQQYKQLSKKRNTKWHPSKTKSTGKTQSMLFSLPVTPIRGDWFGAWLIAIPSGYIYFTGENWFSLSQQTSITDRFLVRLCPIPTSMLGLHLVWTCAIF